ncbi:hypothetical protein EUX98_g5804 [Antrodiella citrinella]|uniref:Uncharacterized protein n=1 Tax=Antrodiella citrinella TaxID=2447956 RepID=A0A4S4MSR2_9APHY|nr:hypothetical protein EUX98_g5804 [Antrodiella citrinella]
MPGSDAGAVVTLRKLRLLMLVGTAKKVAFILNRISCPASTRLSLVAGIRTQMEMEQFFSSVAWKLSGEKSQAVSELRELNTVWLDIQQPNGFNFRGWREYQSRDILSNKKVLPTFREREDGDLNLTLNWNSFTEPPPMVWETKAIQKMCSFMPVQDAKHIYLVNARGDAISVIADLLFSDKHSPWPVITNLVLHKIDFSSKIAGVAEILSALFLRTRWNMPIENFVLLECTDVRETDITSLATVVEHVEWDGRT